MKNYFPANLEFLRKQKKATQAETATGVGLGRSTYANYEAGVTEPGIEVIGRFVRFYGINADDLLFRDLAKGNPSVKTELSEKGAKGEPSGKPSGNPMAENVAMVVVKKGGRGRLQPENVEQGYFSADDMKIVPIVDISVAAGEGYMNPEHMEVKGHLSIPKNSIGRGFHLIVRNKGISMEPCLPDHSLLVVRLLEKQEWKDMRDEEIYVVTTKDGASYVKTVKNRFSKGFIVLMSENPDKAAYPNFNLESSEIHNIWHVDCALVFRFRRVYNQYLDRLRSLEDSVEEMRAALKLSPRKEIYPLE